MQVELINSNSVGDSRVITWGALGRHDEGVSLDYPAKREVTVAVAGEFGVGGACTLQGSRDQETWETLRDTEGRLIIKTTAGAARVADKPRFIRPIVLSGDAKTALVATLYIRKAR
jgi:hypothetical protein